MSSSSGNTTPVGASYELVVGPLLIGVAVNALVLGVCVMQLISYLMDGYKDGWKMHVLLAWVYALDMFTFCTSISMMWHYVVNNFANPTALAFGPWEYATLPIFSMLASVPIQHFMALRIMRFSGSKLLFAAISFLSISAGALGIASATWGTLNPAVAKHKEIIPLADSWLAMSAACDLTITVLLLYYLLKSRTGFKRTDSIIWAICMTTVKAAVPVTVLCLLDLIFLTAFPNNNLHYMCHLPVGRLYTNTLMSTLNDRNRLRTQMENSNPTNGISLGALTTSKHRFQIRPAQVRVNIEHDTDGDRLDRDGLGRRPSYAPPYSPGSPHHQRFSSATVAGRTRRGRGVDKLDLDLDLDLERKDIDDVDVDVDVDVDAIMDEEKGSFGTSTEAEGGGGYADSKASPISPSETIAPQRVVVGNLPRGNGPPPNATVTTTIANGNAGAIEESGVKFDSVGPTYPF